MGKSIRMTFATAMVLQALHRGFRYGFDIIEATGIRSGTIYPLLRRFEDAGLVRARWESVVIARSSHRPSRKYYELTKAADPLLEEALQRFPALDSLPATAASGRRA